MTPLEFEMIEKLLGRKPLGLRSIAVRSKAGLPQVLQVASIVRGQPFPTLFWLLDPEISKKIDELESKGHIALLEDEIAKDKNKLKELEADHLDYINRRKEFLDSSEVQTLKELNCYDSFMSRGIGGIADFTKVRCFHMHYAFHLVRPCLVGKYIDHQFSLK